ncbi:MAG: peptidoglycan-binding protein [Rubellimicrobium sp.]|nr:peptidoglycan-binding protein [Rubellimicrobium sp.]
MRWTVPVIAICAAACAPDGDAARTPLPALVAAEISHDAEGRCWGHDTAPAVVETVTAQELATPAVHAEDGTLVTPATYRSVIRQRIVRERDEQAFETLCPPAYSQEFVETLQRALAARGFYQGGITGILDGPTRRAVQDYQRGWGPDSPLLSLEAARRLGLAARTREWLEAQA